MTKSGSKAPKKGRGFLRALVLVIVFCLAGLGIFLGVEHFSDKSEGEPEPEIIAITVSGEEIILNDDELVTLEALREYLDFADGKGELFTVALINDTVNPADVRLYNSIVDLLGEYGIECEKMTEESTEDEFTAATADEA